MITYKTTDECDELNCTGDCAVPLYCPPRNKQSKSQDTLEDDFPFLKVGYVSSLEGISSCHMISISTSASSRPLWEEMFT